MKQIAIKKKAAGDADFHDELTIAQSILRELKMDKKEMRRCQKKSGYLDEIMRKFINSCD